MSTAIPADPSPTDTVLILRFQAGETNVVIDEPFCEEIYRSDPVPPSAALEREEFHQQLDAALPALTPCQRAVFEMRYNDELSLKAISRQLGRSTGTIKAHLFHARRALHHQLLPYFQFAL